MGTARLRKFQIDDLQPITGRERELAHLVGEGLSDKQISEKMGLTSISVELYIQRILEKRMIRDRAELQAIVQNNPEKLGHASNFFRRAKAPPAPYREPECRPTAKEKLILNDIFQNVGRPDDALVVEMVRCHSKSSIAFAGLLTGLCFKYLGEQASREVLGFSVGQQKILHHIPLLKHRSWERTAEGVGSQLGLNPARLSAELIDICRKFARVEITAAAIAVETLPAAEPVI
jgi:DNA-binding CsgD family transcriptional regulator